MGKKREDLLNAFLRSFTQLFTLKDMVKVFASAGVTAGIQEVKDYLSSSPYVFPLQKDNYITKAGAFTGKIFSIKPTSREIEQKVIVIGDRCIPFVNSESGPFNISFFADNAMLNLKTGCFDSETAIKMHRLFGEEYAPQYIASDPASAELDIAGHDYELPSKVFLTGFDLEPLIRKQGFKKGDRLVCSVSDWDRAYINVVVYHDEADGFNHGKSGDERIRWYKDLEKGLLESFDRHGPADSIETQLETVFFENTDKLCILHCGSLEEYLDRYAKKVGIEFFGVETRLWKKGEDVPAVGKWNIGDFEVNDAVRPRMSFWSTPDFVFDQYVLDMLYRRESDCEKIIPRMYPGNDYLNDEYQQELLLLLESRSAILSEDYNWFADRVLGPVRQKALELYTKVSELVFKIDSFVTGLDKFPQQELVILSQLYSHITRILQGVADNDGIEEESESYLLSIEGMNWNFEDVKGVLESAVERCQLDRFKVIKR